MPSLLGRCGGGGGVVAWGAVADNITVLSVPAYPAGAYAGNWDFSPGVNFHEDGSGVFAYDPIGNPDFLTATIPDPSKPTWFVVGLHLDSHSDPTVYPFARSQVQLLLPSRWPGVGPPNGYFPGTAPPWTRPAPAGIPETVFESTTLWLNPPGNNTFFAGLVYANIDNAGGNALDLRGAALWAALVEI